MAAIPAATDDPATWRRRPRRASRSPAPRRSAAGSTRRAGPGWLLVGDAAGFLDPFTGEGLHRALVSTELAAAAIDADCSDGDARALGRLRPRDAAPIPRRRTLVSWLVQAFLARPAAFEYAARRLAARPDVRATMGLVMGDLVPATAALDPRFLAALLAP